MKQIILFPDDAVDDHTCDLALDLGATAVSVLTRDESHEWFSDPALPFWENTPAVKLIIHVASEMNSARYVEQLTAFCGWDQAPPWQVQDIPDRDWIAEGKKQAQPIRIDDNFWIIPTWHDIPQPEAINLRLDPGLAFGSGTHPTTRLCLEWLTRHCHRQDTLLDYGCGSGILATAAALLGVRRVTATDNDPQALQATRQNATLNKVDITVLDPHDVQKDFHIIVANILANPLISLAPVLAGLLKPDGRLVLSGILPRQIDAVVAAYGDWISFEQKIIKDDWVLLWGWRLNQR